MFKQWWRRLKNVKPTPLHNQAFQAPRLHILPAIILQLYNIHHLDNDPLDDPVIIMDLPHGDLTNVQSPSVAVHDEDVHQDVPGAHRGIAPAPEAQLVPGTNLHGKVGRGPSLSGLLHLHVEVIDNPLRSTINHMTTPRIRQLFRLLRGGKANIPPGTTTQRMIPIILSSLPVTSGNRGASGRTTPRIPLPCINLHGMIPRSLPIAIPPPPTALPPNHSQHSPPPSQHLHATRKASLTLLEISVSIPTGHMLINLRDGSKAEWIRAVKFGLRHKDQMQAASEISYADQPQPNKTVNIEDFQRAVATLQRIDSRIPAEVTRKAIHLISSTNLLPVFDLEQSFIFDLPSTNMLALILPIREISRFTMPPPFEDAQNHTWALLHGTSCWKENQTGSLVVQ